MRNISTSKKNVLNVYNYGTVSHKRTQTQGSEVIALLEMLGGKNNKCLHGTTTGLYYFIESNEIWSCEEAPFNYVIFTLEEFKEKFPYKIGDKVILKETQEANTILNITWDDNIIYYDIISDRNVNTYYWKTEDLQPYKEKTLQENINESFNKTNQVVFEAQAHCCDITKSLIDKEQELTKTTKMEIHNISRITKIDKDKYEILAGKDYKIVEENGKFYIIRKSLNILKLMRSVVKY